MSQRTTLLLLGGGLLAVCLVLLATRDSQDSLQTDEGVALSTPSDLRTPSDNPEATATGPLADLATSAPLPSQLARGGATRSLAGFSKTQRDNRGARNAEASANHTRGQANDDALRNYNPHANESGPGESSIVLSLQGMARAADRIIVGRVIGSESRWNKKKTLIFTYVTMLVEKTLKGQASRTVVLRVVGGTIADEDVSLEVSHQPKFRSGDQGVVFITDDPSRSTSVVGARQGYLKFDQRGTEKEQVFDGFGRTIHGVSGDNRLETDKSGPKLSSDELLRQIVALAN